MGTATEAKQATGTGIPKLGCAEGTARSWSREEQDVTEQPSTWLAAGRRHGCAQVPGFGWEQTGVGMGHKVQLEAAVMSRSEGMQTSHHSGVVWGEELDSGQILQVELTGASKRLDSHSNVKEQRSRVKGFDSATRKMELPQAEAGKGEGSGQGRLAMASLSFPQDAPAWMCPQATFWETSSGDSMLWHPLKRHLARPQAS